MDPQQMALLAQILSGSKLGDPSGATMDPILAFAAGNYRPKPQFDESTLYDKMAPTFMWASAEGETSPRAIAAAQIRSGVAPWTLKKDKELRGDMDSKEWDSFVDALAKEHQAVKAKMMDIGMEQDPFQKAGLPGYNDKYTAQDMYQFAPKKFGDILAGLPEAQTAWDKRSSELDSKYGDVLASSDADRMKLLLAKRVADQRSYDSGRDKDSVMSTIGHWFDIGAPKHGPKALASADLKKLGNTPIVDASLTAKNKSQGAFIKSLLAQNVNSAPNKANQAAVLATAIQQELETKGRSPLGDAIVSQATTRAKLKNGK
jgi:hypothetical protein